MGTGPFDFRITDIYGQVIIDREGWIQIQKQLGLIPDDEPVSEDIAQSELEFDADE